MSDEFKNVTEAVREFYKTLQRYPDEIKYFTFYSQFIKQLMRTKTEGSRPLPITEIMTVIKNERPMVFSALKKLSSNTMYILTGISMDLNDAKCRLEKIISE